MPVYSSIEQLSSSSDLVVLGTVKGVVAHEVDYGTADPDESQGQGLPTVFYEVAVNETLRGDAGSTIILGAPDVDQVTMSETATALRGGEQVLLFLEEQTTEDAPGITAYDYFYMTLSLDNGVFDRLDGDLIVPRMTEVFGEVDYSLAEIRGKVLSGGTLRPILLAQPSPDWTLVNVPGWAGQVGFSLRIPPGWRVRETQGIDSYVGQVLGDGVRLGFDYGLHSWRLNPADDPEHDYAVIYEDIGGVQGKLLISVDASGGGATGVYFSRLDGPMEQVVRDGVRVSFDYGSHLNLIGHDLTPEQQRTAVAIFRSIRSGNVPGGTSIEVKEIADRQQQARPRASLEELRHFEPGSFSEMVASSDVAVVGVVSSVLPSDEFRTDDEREPPIRTNRFEIDVEEVLVGSLDEPSIVLRAGEIFLSTLHDTAWTQPGERSVLFLENMGLRSIRRGNSPDVDHSSEYMSVNSQGVYRVDGQNRFEPAIDDDFTSQVSGWSMQELRDAIQRAQGQIDRGEVQPQPYGPNRR